MKTIVVEFTENEVKAVQKSLESRNADLRDRLDAIVNPEIKETYIEALYDSESAYKKVNKLKETK